VSGQFDMDQIAERVVRVSWKIRVSRAALQRRRAFSSCQQRGSANMSLIRNTCFGLLASAIATAAVSLPAAAQQQQKPNIVVIMGDDIGMWNIGAYHRGLMAGRTPNLDKIA